MSEGVKEMDAVQNNKVAAHSEIPVYSKDVIADAIYRSRPFESDKEQLADEIIKALAEKHLHIFKSKGVEL
jgi:hypothetical protein